MNNTNNFACYFVESALFHQRQTFFYPSACGWRGIVVTITSVCQSVCPWDGLVLCSDHFLKSIHWSFFKFSGIIVLTLDLCLAGLIFFWLNDLCPHMALNCEHLKKKLLSAGAYLSGPFLGKYPLKLLDIFWKHCPNMQSVPGGVNIFLTYWPMTSHDLKVWTCFEKTILYRG